MVYSVFAVRDKKAGFFLDPFLAQSEGQAVRDTSASMRHIALNNPKVDAEDFSLFALGTFDSESGLFDQDPVPRFLIDFHNPERSDSLES